ncbi:SixA phosphatase family protein [Granulicoccus phenolivorans]|uniref:SixA phosphatase family protein n=1 Tax=Granulicoccus phenolivorans TaxID=266854 RepID=UPI00040C3113|nr:histidine phosphatase family protein [Granulicoccus phenolivorans]
MPQARLLLLMRHAEAADFAPGLDDSDRPLTRRGQDQARAVGAALAEHGVRIDQVLCSSAARTRQTLDLLGVQAPVTFTSELYNAGSQAIREEIGLLADSVSVALVLGHAPGIPTLAHDLSDERSDPELRERIARGYPTSTLVAIELDGNWNELRSGKLIWAAQG